MKLKNQSGVPGNRTPITCVQNRCLPIGPEPHQMAPRIQRTGIRRLKKVKSFLHSINSNEYPEQGSNLQTFGFKPNRSSVWRTWASFHQIVQDGVEPSFPVCKTGVVAVGPQDRKQAPGTMCQNHTTASGKLPPGTCLKHVPKDSNPD